MPTPSFTLRSGGILLNILGERGVDLGTNCIRLYCAVLYLKITCVPQDDKM